MRGMPRLGWLLLGALLLDALVLWLLRGLPLYRRDGAAAPASSPAAFLIEVAPPPPRPEAAKVAPPPSPRFIVPTQTVPAPASSGAAVPAAVSPVPSGAAASGPGALSSLPAVVPGQASLFNVAVPSRRVVYLVDASGSMLDRFSPGDPRSRYEAAAQEVGRSLAGLAPDAAFDVVLFADRTVALAPEPVAPTPEARARAEAFLGRLPDGIGGGTDLLEGLAAAWRFNPDAVFLLTDGGATDAEWKLVRAFAALQAAAPPIRLYAFGLASPMADNGDRLLLKLCAMTGGSYQGLEGERK